MDRRRAYLGLLSAMLAVTAARAADAPPAERVIPDVALPTTQGGTARVVEGASALTGLVFFRAGQDRSVDTLRMLQSCRPRLAKEPVRLVGVVPADSAAEAPKLVKASGLDLPVVIDTGDQIYAAAGVRMHPAVILVDRARRVVGAEAFHQVDFCDLVVVRVQRALGKIGDAEVARVVAPPATQLPGAAPGNRAHRHVALARKLLASRSYKQAHDNARRALVLAPSAEAWRTEGEIFLAERQCPDAVRAFDSALALDPRDAAASRGRQACRR
jgi:peroxiredoxin